MTLFPRPEPAQGAGSQTGAGAVAGFPASVLRWFLPVFLAAGLLLTAALAYERFLRGQPALQDFLAFQERGPLPAIRPPFYHPFAGLPLKIAAAAWLPLNVAAGLASGWWPSAAGRPGGFRGSGGPERPKIPGSLPAAVPMGSCAGAPGVHGRCRVGGRNAETTEGH